MVGIYDTVEWEDHVLPHGTHYDWDQSDYTFLLQVFGGKKNPPVTVEDRMVFLLYNRQWIMMDLVIGDYNLDGNGTSAFFRADLPKSSECEPYAFIVKGLNGNWWRLPEDPRYYFATVDDPDKLILNDGSANCMENHYFYTGREWVANGGDGKNGNLTNDKNTANGCIGCSKIAALETVYNARDNIAVPTTDPTLSPTTSAPTPPTKSPATQQPTAPTLTPTLSPSRAPTTTCGDYQCVNVMGLGVLMVHGL